MSKKTDYKLINFLITVLVASAVSIVAFSNLKNLWNPRQIEKIAKNDRFPFCFAFMGDSHDGYETMKSFNRSIEKDGDILFTLHGGDFVTDGGEGEYKKFLDILKKSHKPVIVAIGNHDVRDGGYSHYNELMGRPFFRFDTADAAFFVLDISDPEGGSFTGDQRQWLEQGLKDAQVKKYRIVSFHIPLFEARIFPFDPDKHPKKITDLKMKRSHGFRNRKLAFELMELFKKYNVNYIFAAHNHAYYEGFWGGVPFIISGGAGGRLKRRDPPHEFHHYVKACIDQDEISKEVVKIQ